MQSLVKSPYISSDLKLHSVLAFESLVSLSLFQKYGFRKIFVQFVRSRSLDFCADYQRLGISNFCKVVSDYRSRCRILKSKKSLGLAKENAILTITLSLPFTIRHP